MTHIKDLQVLCVMSDLTEVIRGHFATVWFIVNWVLYSDSQASSVTKDIKVKNSFNALWVIKTLEWTDAEAFHLAAAINVLPLSSQISAPAIGRQHDLYVMLTRPVDRLKEE